MSYYDENNINIKKIIRYLILDLEHWYYNLDFISIVLKLFV